MAAISLAAAIAATLAVAVGAAVGPTGGVYGTVTKSPTTPVCVEGMLCSAPAAGVTVQALQGVKVVARAITDTQGRYRIRLLPGAYRLRVAHGLKPLSVAVTVRAGWVRRSLRYDTGIRSPSPSTR